MSTEGGTEAVVSSMVPEAGHSVADSGNRVRAAEPVVSWLHLEPDIHHADSVRAERSERPGAPVQ